MSKKAKLKYILSCTLYEATGEIKSTTEVELEEGRQMMQNRLLATHEQLIISQLIDLGWTPPPKLKLSDFNQSILDKRQLKKEHKA